MVPTPPLQLLTRHAIIARYPRGPVAPGLKAYVEIEVAVNVPGPLSCTVNIKSGQKLITVPLTAHLSLRKMKQDHPGAPARNALEHPERPWPLLPEMWEHTQREVGEAGKLLDRIAVLNMCPKAQKKEFAARLRRCRFEPEDVLIQQGDMSTPPRILFIAQVPHLKYGHCVIYKRSFRSLDSAVLMTPTLES